MDAGLFINNMLGEMIDRIINGREALPEDQKTKLKAATPSNESNYFTWCTPGIPVDASDFSFLKGTRAALDYEKWKDLPEEEKKQKRGDEAYALTVAMDNFSVLVDTVPNKQGIVNGIHVWQPQNRISHIYASALNNCEVADTIPSPEDQARIDEIRAQTMPQTVEKVNEVGDKTYETIPSKIETAYSFYQAEYLNVFSKYVDMMIKASTGDAGDVQRASMLGPQLYRTVTAAYDKWESNGFKTKYEKMMADLAQLEGGSMTQLLKDYREIFAKSKRTSLLDSLDYNVSRIVPASFYESAGWTHYSFSSSELKTVDRSKTQKYGGSGRYGLFFAATGGHESEDVSSSFNFEGATMEFELTQVPIVRGWLREDFLTSSKWRFKDSPSTNAADLLSNGDSINPEGKLFAYPTVVMFARNIALTKSIYDKVSSEATRRSSGNAGFNFGPFNWGGSGKYNQTEKNLSVKQVEDKMVNKGTFIIGFRNHIVSRSPNPDPAVTKWI